MLLENEFGEVGVDSAFFSKNLAVREINNGCICCSLQGDFEEALEEIEEMEVTDLIIEPSGVGKLSDVIIAVQDAGIEELELNGFTTVVDAKLCKMYMANFGEFYENQIEHASSVILSHTKGLSDDKLKECVDIIRKHNDHASIVTTDWDELMGSQILETMEQKKTLSAELDRLREEAYEHEHEHEHEHHHHEHHHHEHDEHEHHHHDHDEHEHGHHHEHEHGHHHADEVFSDIGEETANKYTVEQIENALQALQDEEKCGQILRAKGIVEGTDGQWIHFDYIPGEPEVRRGDAETTGMICVIGVDIKEDTVRGLFNL